MARHNREGQGCDQQGHSYSISYQPDWLRQIKVTRLLESGRQSTKTLFTNLDGFEQEPGRQVRTEIRCEESGVAFEIAITDPDRVVKRVIIETGPGDTAPGTLGTDDVQFTLDHRP